MNTTVHEISFWDAVPIPGQKEPCRIMKYIINGIKKVEGRKNSPAYQKIKSGDNIRFTYTSSDTDRKEWVLCEVTEVRKYAGVKEYLIAEEEADNGPMPCVQELEAQIAVYEQFNTSGSIAALREKYGHGFLGIGIRVINVSS